MVTPDLRDSSVTVPQRLIGGRLFLYALIMVLAAIPADVSIPRLIIGEIALAIAAVLPSLSRRLPWNRRLAMASVIDVTAAFAMWLVTGEAVLTILIVLWGIAIAAFLRAARTQSLIGAMAIVLELAKAPIVLAGGAPVRALELLGSEIRLDDSLQAFTAAASRALIVAGAFYFLKSIGRLHSQAVDTLNETDRRHRAILEASPVPVLVVNEGIVDHANRSACEFFGMLEGDLLGADILPWVDQNMRRAVTRLLEPSHGAAGSRSEKGVIVVTQLGETRIVDINAATMGFDHAESIQLTLNDVTERVAAERAVRESEAWFRSAFVDSATPFGLSDFEGRLVGVNQAFADLLESTPEDLIGGEWAPYISPDDLPEVGRLMEAAAGTGDQFSTEFRMVTTTGRTVWTLVNVALLRDADGRPARFFGQFFDITQRVDAERARAASEARYGRLFERIPVALYRTQMDGMITDSNPALADLLGFDSAEEVRGLYATDAYAKRPDRTDFLEKITADGSLQGHEIELIREDGESIWVQDSALVVDEGTGTEVIEGALINVTDRVHAERALRTRVDQQQVVARLGHLALTSDIKSLFDAAATDLATLLDGVVVGLFRSLDENTVRLEAGVGWDEGSVGSLLVHLAESSQMRFVMGSAEPVITESLPEETRYEPSQFLLTSGVGSGVSVRIAGQAGTCGVIGVWGARSRTFTPDDVHFVEAIANLIAAALERQQARERLQELIASKDEFVASVSHELRTPLTVVNGMAQELRLRRSTFSESEIDEFIKLMAEQSTDMANLIEDLLVAARADIGKVAVSESEIDIAATIPGVLESLNQQDNLVTKIDPVCAIGDAGRIRQILRNLITNARRYGAPPITIGARQDGTEILISVTDGGPGIPEEDQARIFEPYNRAHHAVGVPASVGLGLTVSRTLAELMGGSLVYRFDGESTFELRLRASESQAISQDLPAASKS